MHELSNNLPTVSVVMPVRNEADFIGRGLGAVLGQDYPHELLEVIVADGMSTDETRAIIGRLAGGSDIPVSVVDNPRMIAPSALNRAIEAAAGEIIVRVDGHCEIEPDYVSNCVRHLLSGKAEGVGGPIETIGDSLLSQAIAVAMSSKFGVGGSAFRTGRETETYTDTVAFPGYTRKILELAGPFNEELVRNQDDEYNYRIRKLGGRILLAPDIRSKYYSRATLRKLWRQYFQYGYWKVRVLQLHPKQMSLRQFVPFVFVSTLILLAAVSVLTPFALIGLMGVLCLYGLADLLATVSVSRRIRPIGLPLVFISFAILHFSYGLGSLAGLFRFAGRWGEKTDVPVRNAAFNTDTAP